MEFPTWHRREPHGLWNPPHLDKPTKLNAVPATVNGGEFSLDESTIVFAAQTPEDAPPGYDELFALPKETSGAATVRLTSGFLGQVNGHGLYFESDGSLIASANIGTTTRPVRIALNGKTSPVPIDMGASVVSGLNTNRKHTGWVWLAEGGGEEEKLCYAEKLGDVCEEPLNTPEQALGNLRWVKRGVGSLARQVRADSRLRDCFICRRMRARQRCR